MEDTMSVFNTQRCLPLLMLGCVEVSTFNSDYSMLVCDKLATCAPGALDTGFGSQDTCELSVQERLDVLRDDPSCRFDSSAAADCIAQTDSLSCEVWLMYGEPESCEEGYICQDEVAGGLLTEEVDS